MLRFLVVIVTWFHSWGGLPHQRARWFAMTGNRGTARQTTICLSVDLQRDTGKPAKDPVHFVPGLSE